MKSMKVRCRSVRFEFVANFQFLFILVVELKFLFLVVVLNFNRSDSMFVQLFCLFHDNDDDVPV